MNTDYPKKVNYQDYEHAFNSYLLKKFVEGQLRDFDTETMRGLIYGYTFTEDYAKGIIPDELSAEYWKQKNKGRLSGSQRLTCAQLSLSEYLGQELLICEAIESTGGRARLTIRIASSAWGMNTSSSEPTARP